MDILPGFIGVPVMFIKEAKLIKQLILMRKGTASKQEKINITIDLKQSSWR